MSDAEAVTLSADGITVRKTVDTEQFQTLAVVVELASERDDLARVQLVDQIPADVPMEDVGFHPNYGSEHWSVEEGAVAFERDFEPGEAYTTIYGIREYPEDEIEALLGEPELELVATRPDDLDDVVDEGRSQAVREFISGEADLPGLEDELTAEAAEAAAAAAEAAEALAGDDDDEAATEPTPGEEPASTAAESGDAEEPAPTDDPEAAEPAADAPAEAEPADPTEPGTEPEPEPAPAADPDEGASAADDPPVDAVAVDEGGDRREVRVPLTGGVVRVLIKELREGDIDPEDRRMLRDALLGTEGTTEARIVHLQQRVSDLEAYADALEEFIDEEGTAEAVIADLRDDVAGLEREVRSVDDRLDEVVDDVGAFDTRLDDVAGNVADVESRAEVLADRVEDAGDDIAAVDGRVDDLGARHDQLSTDVDGIDDQLGEVDGQVRDLREDLQSLRRDLQDDIDSLAADLEDFEAFRDRLSSVFGGGGAGSFGSDESVTDDE